MSVSPVFTWDEALQEFLLHCKATRAHKTYRYYKVQLGQLVIWAAENQIPFVGFGKRHMDRYLIHRQEQGSAPMTLHHDAKCAKKFMDWCSKNDILERSLLAEYEVRAAPRPPMYMPTDADVDTLLNTIHDYWNLEKHPQVKYYEIKKRIFHRDRNYALIVGLLDTACRIGEMVSLKVDDYRAKDKQIVIRMSKGREPRVLPISDTWNEAIEDWLKVRRRVMQEVPADKDAGWLFINEYGDKVDPCHFLNAIRSYLQWAGLPKDMTLHSLRRYSLNKLAKISLLAAQQIAGHKETKTTLLYTKLDPEFLRAVHGQANVARSVVQAKRPKRQKLI